MDKRPSHEQLDDVLANVHCVPRAEFERRLEAQLETLLEQWKDTKYRRSWFYWVIFRSALNDEEDTMTRRTMLTFSVGVLTLALILFVGLVLLPELRTKDQAEPAAEQPSETLGETPLPTPEPTIQEDTPSFALGSGIPITISNAAQLVEISRSPQQGYGMSNLFFSPGGETVFGTAFVWRLDRNEAAAFPLTEVPTDAALSPDGSRLVIATNRMVRQWSVGDVIAERDVLLRRDNVSALIFLADGSALAMGCCEQGRGAQGLTVVDSVTRESRWTLPFESKISALSLSPDGTTLAVGSIGDLALVDAESGEVLGWLNGPSNTVSALDFSGDGLWLAASSGDGNIYLWSVASDDIVLTINAHSQFAEAVALSHDGSLLASAGRDGAVRLWDTASQELLLEITSEQASGFESWMTGVAFSPDGTLFATGGVEGWVRIFGVPSR